MNGSLDAMKTAARAAIGRVRQSMNIPEADDDLNRYLMLKPSDFPGLMKKYGTEQTLAYIKDMENRLARRNNANQTKPA